MPTVSLTLTDSALLTANTVVANATSVMNSDAELSSKTTAVEASKQANAAFSLMLIVKCRYNYPVILIPFNNIKRLYR
jgi:hypothetical protein